MRNNIIEWYTVLTHQLCDQSLRIFYCLIEIAVAILAYFNTDRLTISCAIAVARMPSALIRRQVLDDLRVVNGKMPRSEERRVGNECDAQRGEAVIKEQVDMGR